MASIQDDNMDRIVQSCLDLIQSGHDTIDTILERYPELEGELRPRLESAAWLSSRRGAFDPRPGFVRASRARLVAQIQEEMKVASSPADSLSTGKFWRFWQTIFRSKRYVFQLAIVLLLVVSFIMLSSGVALAAQGALPGEPFYPVKIALENAEVAVTPGNSRDAQLRIAFAQKRLVEMQTLILEGHYQFIPQTVTNFELQVNQAVKLMNAVANQNSEKGKELAVHLQRTLSEQTTVLQVLAEAVPQGTKPEIERAIETSRFGTTVAGEVIDSGHGASNFTPTPSSTATGSLTGSPTPGPSFTATPTESSTLPAKSTPTGSPTSISPVPTLTGTPGPVQSIKPSPTSTSHPEPTKKPKPTKKPTKTPKPLPDPTRRPPKP